MKRFHIHVGVESLERSIAFYSALFDAQPTKVEVDYAKWMLDDPRINFAISTRATKTGVDHLGIQVDEEGDLQSLRARLTEHGFALFDEGKTVCCYAQSEKSWVADPDQTAWETYRTMADARVYSQRDDADGERTSSGDIKASACCAAPVEKNGCCT